MEKGKIILIVAILGGFTFLVVFAMIKYKVEILNRPEQYEQVVVVEKRILRQDHYEGSSYNDYLVTFRFPDGLVKELRVGSDKREIYDSMQVGEIGLLTYKERENIEEKIKKEKNRWMYRLFISFKKDLSPEIDE